MKSRERMLADRSFPDLILKAAVRLAASLGALILVVLVLYLGLIHPNDGRLDQSWKDRPMRPLTEFQEKISSLLDDNIEHHLDIDDASFEKAKAVLKRQLPDYALVESTRFTSRYQVYAPIGSYPHRLEGLDAIYIPAGTSLRLKPRLTEDVIVELSGIAAGGAGFLVARQNGTERQRFALTALKAPLDERGFWTRNFWNFLRLDRSRLISRWQQWAFSAPLKLDDDLTFSCEIQSPSVVDSVPQAGCLVAEVSFFRRISNAPQNAIVILVDTLRGDAPFKGHAPAMAALAKESAVFTRALAPGNMTSPSTNSLLACRGPSELGGLAFSYVVDQKERIRFYERDEPSFPARFRQAGYTTAMIGNVSVISEVYGLGVSHGFAHQVAIESEGYDTPEIAREAVNWLQQYGNRKFLLYLHFHGPHAPYRAPLADLWETFPGWGALQSYSQILRWLYQGEVHYTDRYIAAVLTALRGLGLDQSTAIVLTGDHGDHHTGRIFSGNEAGPAFEGAYFDHGATLLNDEIQVPFFFRSTARREGKRVKQIVSTLDLAPTLFDEFELPVPSYCTGRSLMPVVRNDRQLPADERVVVSEGYRSRAIVFDNRYKYIYTYEPTDKVIFPSHGFLGHKTLYMATEQLFDIESDPLERLNLANSQPQLLQRGRNIYKETFNLSEVYELVVEARDSDAFEVILPDDVVLHADFPKPLHRESRQNRLHLSGYGAGRLLVRLDQKLPRMQLPEVYFNGIRLDLAMTSIRLPLRAPIEELPLERRTSNSIFEMASSSAFLRRVVDHGHKSHRIVTNNPRFEKILREWGYLNDR